MTCEKPIDSESAAIAALAVAILKEDPTLLGRRVEFAFLPLPDGSVEVWADDRRRGIIPAPAIEDVAREVRHGRN